MTDLPASLYGRAMIEPPSLPTLPSATDDWQPLPARGALRVDRFACGGAQAVLWTVPGGGSPWPTTPPGPDATREIWRFFAALVPAAPRSNP